ncbi:MAG: hypothetical protein NTW52_15125 [Planctomycetota bacterium]|nr:hypothetical protein [Planctomycetota bacterium]
MLTAIKIIAIEITIHDQRFDSLGTWISQKSQNQGRDIPQPITA